MRHVTCANYQEFIAERRYCAIHFDAPWDGYYLSVHRSMIAAGERFPDSVNIGRVDVDADPQLAATIPIVNVPTVGYYKCGNLVAALIGAQQDVIARLERLIRNEQIGYNDGTKDR